VVSEIIYLFIYVFVCSFVYLFIIKIYTQYIQQQQQLLLLLNSKQRKKSQNCVFFYLRFRPSIGFSLSNIINSEFSPISFGCRTHVALRRSSSSSVERQRRPAAHAATRLQHLKSHTTSSVALSCRRSFAYCVCSVAACNTKRCQAYIDCSKISETHAMRLRRGGARNESI